MGLPAISPDQLSALIDAHFGGAGGTGRSILTEDRTPMAKGFDLGNMMGTGTGVSALSDLASGTADPFETGTDARPQEARVETNSRPLPPSPQKEKQPSLRHRPNPYAD